MRGTAALAALLVAGSAQAKDHVEVVFGFHGGARSWSDVPYAWTDDEADGLAGSTGAFDGTPFRDTVGVGPLLEVRHVSDPARVTFGYRPTFPHWIGEQAPTARTQHGQRVPSAVGAAFAHELRLGVGVELPALGDFTPFADLMGDLTWIRAQLALDGEPYDLVSISYALVPRAGIRWELSEHAFVEAAGEYGIFGPTDYGGHVVVGFISW